VLQQHRTGIFIQRPALGGGQRHSEMTSFIIIQQADGAPNKNKDGRQPCLRRCISAHLEQPTANHYQHVIHFCLQETLKILSV